MCIIMHEYDDDKLLGETKIPNTQLIYKAYSIILLIIKFQIQLYLC